MNPFVVLSDNTLRYYLYHDRVQYDKEKRSHIQ